MLLTFNQEIQAADTERRVISGLVAPYGEIGHTSAGPVMFQRGSITYAEASEIKLLMQHQPDKPVGRAISFSEGTSPEGIYGSFKLSSSTRGQDALVLAQENLVCGLSVGVDVTASKPMGDYLLVTAAVLKEVSLVESAAFSSASVTDIAAARAALEAATSTKEKTTTINTTIVEIETETETETESEAAVTTAPENTPEETPVDAPVEVEKVEAARKIIRPSVLDSQRLRTPITSMATYTEHKIKAAMGNDDSKLYVTAADDSFTTNPAFNPTQYLSEFVSNTNFDTPMINALSSGALPPTGNTIQVPSLVTSAGGGSGVAPVVTFEAEAGAVENTGMVTEYLTGTVKKYAGMNTLSVELMERAQDPNFYAELTNQLQRAYSLATDAAVIADVVAGGVQGTAVAATSAGIISYVSTESANIYKNTSYFARNYVAGPSQWSLLMGATDSTGRPIYNAAAPMNSGGLSTPTSIRGNVLGLDLYVDHQMVATTIDDSAFIVAPEAMTVYRSPQAYMSVNVVSNLQVQVAIYGFMATIVKMPNGLVRYNLT
jgi:HK97 family phage prohead protease